MDKHYEELKRDGKVLKQETPREHPDFPEEGKPHEVQPEGRPEPQQEERDYVAETTAKGDGIYDESLFSDEKQESDTKETRTAITAADTRVPATESPAQVAKQREPREEPKQVLPGNHDLTEEEFSQVAEHPNPLDETEVPQDEEIPERDIEEYLNTIGKDKNVTRLDQAIRDRSREPEVDHPHMEDDAHHRELIEREKDREMNEADRFNVFKQSRYRGDQ